MLLKILSLCFKFEDWMRENSREEQIFLIGFGKVVVMGWLVWVIEKIEWEYVYIYNVVCVYQVWFWFVFFQD